MAPVASALSSTARNANRLPGTVSDGPTQPGSLAPFGFDHRHVPQHVLRVLGRRVYYQRLVREIVRGYDAVAFVGYHASAGEQGVLSPSRQVSPR